MPFSDFAGDGSFVAQTGLTRDKLEGLSKINKRTMVVGLFNGKNRGHLYFWGPEQVLRDRKNAFDGEVPSNYHFVDKNNYTSFLNNVQPLIQERILESESQLAVSVGVPVEENEDNTTIHEVTPYIPLYQGHRQKGEEVLKQIESSVDQYLDLLREFPALKAAFNLFLYNHASASNIHKQILASGVEFHSDFDEIFLDYILREDENIEFDAEWLSWDDWDEVGRWTKSERTAFAAVVTTYKKALLEDGSTEVDDEVRKSFQKRREAVLNLGKTVSSNLMLSQLPYWILRTLYGVEPHEVTPAISKEVHGKVTGADEEDRQLELTEIGKAVALAKPKRQLQQSEREFVGKELRSTIGRVIEAWGTQAEDKETLLEELHGHGVPRAELDSIRRGLEIIDRICEGDAKKAKTLRSSLLTVLDTQYLRILVGRPVVHLEEIEDWYVLDLCDAYMQAELYQDGAARPIREAAREKRDYLSGEEVTDSSGHLKGDEESRQKTIASLVSGFLVPTMQSMNENILYSWRALEKFGRLRIESLKEGFRPGIASVNHAEKSEGDGLGKTIKTPGAAEVEELVAVAAAVETKRESQMESESDADATPATAGSGEAPSRPETDAEGDTKPADESGSSESTPDDGKTSEDASPTDDAPESNVARDLRQELRELLDDLEAQDDAATDEDRPKPSDKFIDLARAAYDLIWSTRETPGVVAEFKQLCRRIGLREIFLTKHRGLQFGKDLSSLYQFTLDLVGTGSQNPDRFLQTYSLTEYFDLPTAEDLFDLYRRLELQTKEAAASMARFISEVMCFDYLFDKIKDRLNDSHELIFFNGSVMEFMDWLKTRRSNADVDWDPTALGDPKHILPGAVYITESALIGIEEKGETVELVKDFMDELRNLNLNDDAEQPCSFPPIIVSGTRTFSTDFLWAREFQRASGYDRAAPAFPGPIYYLGPAMEGDRRVTAAGSRIVVPVAAYVLERLFVGRSSERSSFAKRDLKNGDLPSYVFSFSAKRATIDERSKELIEDSLDHLSFEGSMWLHSLSVLYLYLANRFDGGFYGAEGEENFWSCFRPYNEINRNVYNEIMGQRSTVENRMIPRGRAGSMYCVDPRTATVQVWTREQPFTKQEAPCPWLRKILGPGSVVNSDVPVLIESK